MVLWRDYNGRATIEQRIEELKAELAADGFCMQNFFATESAFLAVLFTFNLLSLYQKALDPSAAYRQPATLRSAVFLGGAILGRAARKAVLHLSSALGRGWTNTSLCSLSSPRSWPLPASAEVGFLSSITRHRERPLTPLLFYFNFGVRVQCISSSDTPVLQT